jgi:hypothetical protein
MMETNIERVINYQNYLNHCYYFYVFYYLYSLLLFVRISYHLFLLILVNYYHI